MSICANCGKAGLDPRNVNDLKAHLHNGNFGLISEGSPTKYVEMIGPTERPDERMEKLKAGQKISLGGEEP